MAKRPKLTFQDDAALYGPNQAATLDKVKQMGGKLIQTDAIYGNLHSAGGYDFAKYDQLVNEARKRGLGVRMRLMGTPTYLKQSNPTVDDSLSASHPDVARMAQYARDMSQHFKGRVGGYSVWNEPNVQSFLNQDTRRAASTYRKLYDAASGAIRSTAPGAKISLGELTSQRPDTKGTLSTLGFLRAVIASGKGPLKADALAIHPYQWSNPDKQFGNKEYGGISNLATIQRELARDARAGTLVTGKGGKVPLSISEYGYKHDAQRNPNVRAKWLADSYNLAKQAGAVDFNMYQLMPSAPGRYWDSSILDKQGNVPASMRVALKRINKR